MDRNQMYKWLADKIQFMFDEDFINDKFLELEHSDDYQPILVENRILNYISSSTDYVEKLEKLLETKPLEIVELERAITKLNIASYSFGAEKLTRAVDEMLTVFRKNKTDPNGLNAALGRVKSEHTAFMSHLKPHVEVMTELRISIEEEEEAVELESVGSNVD